jgi:hypothetical protein
MRSRFDPEQIYQAAHSPAPPTGCLTHPVITTPAVMAVPLVLVFALIAYLGTLMPSEADVRTAEDRATEVALLAIEEYRRTGEQPTSLLDVPGVPPEYFAEDADVVRLSAELSGNDRTSRFHAEFTQYLGYLLEVDVFWNSDNHPVYTYRRYRR